MGALCVGALCVRKDGGLGEIAEKTPKKGGCAAERDLT